MRHLMILATLLFQPACADTTTPDEGEIEIVGSTWIRHVIRGPGGTGTATMGADGADVAMLDGELVVATAWEQGGGVTVDALDGEPLRLITSSNNPSDMLPGGEDARLFDIDEDGRLDVAGASQGAKKIKWWPGDQLASDGFDTGILIGAATNVSKWMQLAFGDADGDGHPNLFAGGEVLTTGPGAWGYFTTTNPRSPTAWTFHQVAAIGWTETLELIDIDIDGDLDVYLTDRSGVPGVSVRGSWGFENDGTGAFTPHLIAQVAGDVGQGRAGDFDGDGMVDVIDGNRTALWYRHGTGAWAWSSESIPYPSTAGEFHAAMPCDMDGTGAVQFIITTALAAPGEDGVFALRRDAPGQWSASTISGPDSVERKYDNSACVDFDSDGDLDAATVEGGDVDKLNDIGTAVLENPRT